VGWLQSPSGGSAAAAREGIEGVFRAPPDVLMLPSSLWPTLHRLTAAEGWPPSSPDTADLLVAQASRQGLLPLLLEAEAELPGIVRDRLTRLGAWRALHRRRADMLVEALGGLARLLDGEPWLVLKGAEYMFRLYPRPDLRPMHDLDILVPRERCEAVCARLRAAGLTTRVAEPVQRLASHHERQFLRGAVVVEVHHSFIQRTRHRIDYEAVWRRRVGLPAGPVRTSRLDDTDALVYHALSMAFDEFRVRLVRYVDLWRMLEAAPGIARDAARRARDWRARHAVYGAFRQLVRLCPELEGGEVDTVSRELLAPGVRRFLDRAVLPGLEEQTEAVRPGRVTQLWRKFWLMDDVGHRLAFALSHGVAVGAARWVAWRHPVP
jgi:hypothetical protein